MVFSLGAYCLSTRVSYVGGNAEEFGVAKAEAGVDGKAVRTAESKTKSSIIH